MQYLIYSFEVAKVMEATYKIRMDRVTVRQGEVQGCQGSSRIDRLFLSTGGLWLHIYSVLFDGVTDLGLQ